MDVLQEAKLLNTKERADTYFIEYTIQREEGDLRHLLSSVALGYNGRCAPHPASQTNHTQVCIIKRYP